MGARSGGSPPSRLRPPSAGRRRRSATTSPVSAPRLRGRDYSPSPYSTSPPQQQQQRRRRRLLSPAQGKLTRVRYGGDGAATSGNDAAIHADSMAERGGGHGDGSDGGIGGGGGGARPDRVGPRREPGVTVARGMRGGGSSAAASDGRGGTLDAGNGSHELARLKMVRSGMSSRRFSGVEGRPSHQTLLVLAPVCIPTRSRPTFVGAAGPFAAT